MIGRRAYSDITKVKTINREVELYERYKKEKKRTSTRKSPRPNRDSSF
jgi:hypothetical protein